MNEQGQLVTRVLEGDQAAQRQFYDEHVDRVYRLAYRMTGDDDMARESTQETFIRAFNKLHTFRGDSALSTWMHSVTVSVTLTLVSKVKRLHSREADLERAEIVSSEVASGDHLLTRAIHRAIDALSAAYRVVVVTLGSAPMVGVAIGVSPRTALGCGEKKTELWAAREVLTH